MPPTPQSLALFKPLGLMGDNTIVMTNALREHFLKVDSALVTTRDALRHLSTHRLDHDHHLCRLNTANVGPMATIRANRRFWTTLSDASSVFLYPCALSAMDIAAC